MYFWSVHVCFFAYADLKSYFLRLVCKHLSIPCTYAVLKRLWNNKKNICILFESFESFVCLYGCVCTYVCVCVCVCVFVCVCMFNLVREISNPTAQPSEDVSKFSITQNWDMSDSGLAIFRSRRPSVSGIFAPKTFCLTNQLFWFRRTIFLRPQTATKSLDKCR